MEKVTLKKRVAGEYEIHKAGQMIGYVTGGQGSWFAAAFEFEGCTEVGFTRSEAVSQWMNKYEGMKAEQAAINARYEAEMAMSWEDERKAELQAAIDAKIQKAAEGSQTWMWMGSHKMELTGSKLLDFMEFMFLDSYGSVYDDRSLEKRCESMCETEGCSADAYEQNFIDCWADYQRAWKKANGDKVCDCCKNTDMISYGCIKDGGRVITCPECKGTGIPAATDKEKAAKERTIRELEDLVSTYGEEYHQGFFKRQLDELKAEIKDPEPKPLDEDDMTDYKDPKYCQECLDPYERTSSFDSGLCIHCEIKGVEQENMEATDQECSICGGSGRVADDILCWRCEDPFEAVDGPAHKDPADPFLDEKEQLLQSMRKKFEAAKIPSDEAEKGIKWISIQSLETIKTYHAHLEKSPDLIKVQEG